ncbi:YncE family protein [Flavobacterium sp. RHBU_3]|uniref:YncE family protein n=1 Tax=Flavobacterium sp. RHBU_3 TaxID=3391184 RepID=UPI00398506AE
MKLNKLLLTAIAGSLFFVSCSDDDNNNDAPQGTYDNGVFILNQGGFLAGNASVSFNSDALLSTDVYGSNNPGLTLGDTGQDIGLEGDYAYIVVNYSNKIEVVNRYSFQHVATIEDGLENPRYIAFEGGKAYVTNWGLGSDTTDDYVAIINLATNEVTNTIPVAEGPERIIEEDGNLYVAHKGGWNFGNTITVINGHTNTVTTTITVGDLPDSLEIENGNLYVLNSGLPYYADAETPGSLSVINLATNTVTSTLSFTTGQHPAYLVEDNNTFYYTLGNEIYSMPVTATSLPTAALFNVDGEGVTSLYAFAVNNGKVYVADAGDYTSNGDVYIYSLSGTLTSSFSVGVAPAGFYFNN